MHFLLNTGAKCTLFAGVHRLHRLTFLRCMCTSKLVTKKAKDKSSRSTYQVSQVEAKWYDLWESRNYFKPSKSEKESFVILLPPPNITGTLHLGHALTCTIQDVIVRWKRMKGESVLWVPGVDHAGIATQAAVEKYLAKTSGVTRHDLGREDFVNAIWKWKDEKAPKIIEQLKRMGASLDWSKLIFTLDPSHSDLVKKSFIQLYNDGLIYRKKRLVNWSCALKSSISDLEIDTVPITEETKLVIPGYENPVAFGKLFHFAYKVCDKDDEIVVSTTRPETMLGDVAVAVHPDSPAHSRFKNKYVWHPFRNEKIPVIVDDFVDRNFGTGAVKITPSHSLTDFQVGLRHKLKCIQLINEEGRLNNIGAVEKFHGLKRFDARWAVIKELKELNLFRGSQSHSMTLPVCSRSGDVIEYMEKEQWFLKCDSLVKKAAEVVENGDLEITPQSYKNVWRNWLSKEPVVDWNLSRQLWWGHQIPMYECWYEGKTIWVPGCSLEEAKAKASAELGVEPGDLKVVQDPDVLDTWFSSGLLSMNAVIDRERSPSISLMVTGHDILFFWLARMVMLSMHLKGELPFKEVFLHGLVYDDKGKKMSKSTGNVIHPEDIINGLTKAEVETRLRSELEEGRITEKILEKALAAHKAQFPKDIPECGADALRFTLCSANFQGLYTNFNIHKCVSNNFLCNKIYQGFNYFIKISDAYKEKRKEFDLENVKSAKGKLNCFDLWILSRLADVIAHVDTHLCSYRFDFAADKMKDFIVDDFCNFYLNTTKSILEDCSSSQFKTTFSVFFHCFEAFLRLLSPFMPYITEHLYHAIPLLNGYEKYESVTVAKYPSPSDWSEFRNQDLECLFKKLSDFLTTVRRTKNVFNMNSEKSKVWTKCPDDVAELLFSEMEYVFLRLGGASSLSRVEDFDGSNVISQEIDADFMVFVGHNYDKAQMLKVMEPIIKQESKLKEDLGKLVTMVEGPESEKVSATEKLRLMKDIDSLNLNLKRISEYKSAINHCNR